MNAHEKMKGSYLKIFDRTVKQHQKLPQKEMNQFIEARYAACLESIEKERNLKTEKAQEKKAALNAAYTAFWETRYLGFFNAKPEANDQDIARINKNALAEIHPDKNKNSESASIRREVLRKVLQSVTDRRALFQNEVDIYAARVARDEQSRKRQELKQWFWDKGHEAQFRHNESIQLGAHYLWGEAYASSIAALSPVEVSSSETASHDAAAVALTEEELAARILVPHKTAVSTQMPKQLSSQAQERLLKCLVEELDPDSCLNKTHFEQDQIPTLIWNNVLLQDDGSYCLTHGGVLGDEGHYFKSHEPENIKIDYDHNGKERVLKYVTLPEFIKAYYWTKEHCVCPLDRLAKKYPNDLRFQLNEDGRFLLSLLSRSIFFTDTFNMEYELRADYAGCSETEFEISATKKYENAHPRHVKFVDVALLNDFDLRELGWELIVREVKLYQNQPKNAASDTVRAFKWRLDFIYKCVRLGALSLKVIHTDLILPLQKLIKQLDEEIKEEALKRLNKGERQPLFAPVNSLREQKREQLKMVLTEMKQDIRQGIKDLVTAPDRKDPYDQIPADKKFMANLYKSLGEKLERYAKSPIIGKHQNVIGPLLMGVLGVISSALLVATGVGLVALVTHQEFRRSFGQTFFGTRTQGFLRAMRKQVNKDSEYLRKGKAPKDRDIAYAYEMLPSDYDRHAPSKIKTNTPMPA